MNHLSAYASIELNVDVRDEGFGAALSGEVRRVIAGECREVTADELARRSALDHLWQWMAYRVVRLLFAVATWNYRSLPT